MGDLIFGVSRLAKRMDVGRSTVYELIDKGMPCGKRTGKYCFDYDAVVSWCTSDNDEYINKIVVDIMRKFK